MLVPLSLVSQIPSFSPPDFLYAPIVAALKKIIMKTPSSDNSGDRIMQPRQLHRRYPLQLYGMQIVEVVSKKFDIAR